MFQKKLKSKIKKPMTSQQQQQKNPADSTWRQMSLLEQQLPQKAERFQNVGVLRAKIAILCLSTFYYGYCLAYLSTLSTVIVIKEFGPSTQDSTVKGFLIGILTLGGAVGAFTSPFFMKCFSRRKLILLFNIGSLCIQGLIQYPNIYNLFICRAFQGYFMGNFMALVPVYVNQLCPRQLITKFGVYAQMFVVSGVVFAYGFGIVLTKSGVPDYIMWRIMFAFNGVFILTVIISCLIGFIPQSPNSLIIQGQKQQAKRVINLFIKDQFVQQAFRQKQLQVQFQTHRRQTGLYEHITYGKKAYFIGFLLPLMQQATGINAVVTQIGGIVSKHNPTFGFYTPFIINVIQLTAAILSQFVLRRYGRRPILLSGNYGLGLCDIILGILFLFIDKSDGIFWFVFFILICYMSIYGLTIGPTVWMYVPQIIPAKIVPFATTLNWLSSSFCLIIAPIINASIGSYAVFIIFGSITLFIGVINFFGLLQIKGLTLKQICAAYQQ